MSKLNQEELLEHLAHMFKCYEYNFINVDWKPPEEGVQAHQQIKEMIQKLEVTEEWIEEKAKKMHDMIRTSKNCEYKCALMIQCNYFIRSLVEEIK